MWRSRLVAVLIVGAGTAAAVLLVGMPHFDRGNVFWALVTGVTLAGVAGGVTGALLGGTSKSLAAFFVAPLLLWDAFAVVSALKVGLDPWALALWLGETALLALVFHAAGHGAAWLQERLGTR